MTRTEPLNREQSVHRDFDTFFRDEFERARRLAFLLTRSAEVSEDVAQEAMISVHRRYGSIDEPVAYLTRAVVNQSRTFHRRSSSRRRVHEELTALSPATTPAADEYLLDAVHVLPERQRVAVIARYWGGLSEAEIAQLLGCRPGTVKSLTSRAMARLRKELQLP